MGIASLDDRASTIQGEVTRPSTATDHSRSTLNSELVVADGSCHHIQKLLVGCQASVLWLEGDQDPFLAISQALTRKALQGAPIQTLHWLSHGSPGQLHIGDRSITTATLIAHAQQLNNWCINDLAIWSCSVGSDPTFISVLEELTGATVWASDQPLGRIADGSSRWQLTNALQPKAPSLPISASRQLAWNHQLAGFSRNTPIPQASPGRTSGEWRNNGAFAALKDDGSVITWGLDADSSSVAASLTSGVSQIFSSSDVFAALKDDGSVITWGLDADSSSVAASLTSGVKQIFSSSGDFAALKDDGSVITWGRGGNSSSVSSSLTSGVSQIFSTELAFAALKDDGSVITWGAMVVDGEGYGDDSSAVAASLTSGVSQIFSTDSAFAALKDDGSVITWGNSNNGGDSFSVSSSLTSGVSQIFSSGSAFAALKDDGSVITWGLSNNGGDSSSVSSSLTSGVSQIFSSGSAFAALKDDGSVITWGLSNNGGDSSSVSSSLTSGVSQIFSNYNAFAALKDDGSVITWGNSNNGGDSSSVSSSLTSGVSQIFSNYNAFAALKDDGSVITWGNSSDGGDSSSVSASLTSGVSQIFSTDYAYAALKDDGSVITWGNDSYGGNSSSVAASLTSGVVGFANPFADDAFDSTAPTFISAATSTDGSKLLLTYDENLSTKTPVNSRFSVIVYDSLNYNNYVENEVTAVVISADTVNLTLATPIKIGEVVQVEYIDPNDSTAIQDARNNFSTSFFISEAINNSIVDGSAEIPKTPTFKSAATSTDGSEILLTYSEALSYTTALNSDFVVTTDSDANAVTAVAVNRKTVVLNLTTAITADQPVTVAYNDPTKGDDENAIQDTDGNDAASLSSTLVTNNSTITPNPIPPDATSGISCEQLAAFTAQDIAAFSRTQIKQLPIDNIKCLLKSHFSNLSPKAVKGFTSKQIAVLPKHVFSAMDELQLRKISKDAVTGLQRGQLKTLNEEELSAFKPKTLKFFPADAISGLKPNSLNALSRRQVRAFTDDQLLGMSKKQIKQADDFIDKLSRQQRIIFPLTSTRQARLITDPANTIDDGLALTPAVDTLA